MLPLHCELRPPVALHRLFADFLNEPYPIFLDSSMPHPRLGRYSYIVADPFLVLRSKNGHISVEGHDHTYTLEGDPFEQLRHLMAGFRAENDPGLPPFQGGAVGYFAYDLAHHVESLPRTSTDDLGIPDMVVGLYDWVLAHDHRAGRTWLVVSPFPEGDLQHARDRMEKLRQRIQRSLDREHHHNGQDLGRSADHNSVPASPRLRVSPSPLQSTFTRDRYLDAVRRAKEYIAAGDIYQVNLSQRFQAKLHLTPWELYCRLREVSPVPYSAFLGLGDFAVASASPELFLRKEGQRVETRPIKGTRPRGREAQEDHRLAVELRASEKDRAENVMIVDLLRNDLGKVCRVGSVVAPELYALESYTTVHHLVSTVEGLLEDGQDALSLLKACFPGGSITGCPKIRAMEIIDELEPTQRGIYCGSIGFVGFDGNLDSNIVIRTVLVKDGQLYFQVGGAVVADSDPEAEYQETLDKARAVILALGGS